MTDLARIPTDELEEELDRRRARIYHAGETPPEIAEVRPPVIDWPDPTIPNQVAAAIEKARARGHRGPVHVAEDGYR